MIIVYTPNLQSFTEIEHAISFKFKEYYNGVGTVTLTLAADDTNTNVAQVDGVIYDTETEVSAIVEDIDIDTDTNQITINARTSNNILNRRVFASSHTISTVETGIYDAVNAELRGLGVVTASPAGLTETADATLYKGCMLDQIIPVLEAEEIGQKCVWDSTNRRHVFTIYKGVDRTAGDSAITFSDIDGTATGLKIADDISEFCNVCYVHGVFDEADVTVTVGTASGNTRREVIVEGWSQDDGETLAQYRARLTQCGRENLAERVRRKSFDVEIDPYEYGTAYNLGDIVNCLSNRFGFSFTARITCVERQLDANGESMSLTLGSPKLTIIDEVKLKWQL